MVITAETKALRILRPKKENIFLCVHKSQPNPSLLTLHVGSLPSMRFIQLGLAFPNSFPKQRISFHY